MKPKNRMKALAFTVTFSVLLILSFLQTAFAPPLPIGDPSYPQSNPFDSNPTKGGFDQVGTPTGVIENAFDGDMDTNINIQYGAGDGYVEVQAFKRPSDNGLTDFTISFIDIKIHYRSSGTATSDDRYRIVAYVDPSTTPLVLQDWVTDDDAAYPPGISTNPGTRAFSNVTEPNDGIWTWTDLANLRVRVETDQVDTNDLQKVYLNEVWVTAYSTGYPEPGTMSVQPTIVAGLASGDLFYVDIYVTDVKNMWGYQFVLDFDPAILTPLEYFSYSPFVSALPSEIGPDYVEVAYGTYNGDPVGFTGSTPIARIYFVVVADGTSPLDFTFTEVADIYGNVVPLTARNGLFTAGTVHDVAVTSIKLNVTTVQRGEPIEISATVVNQGTESETFLVAVCFNSTLNATKTVTDLPSGANTILDFVWDTSTMAIGTYQVMAVASIVPGEADTADNTLVDGTVTILYRPEHDLSVHLKAPSYLALGQSIILNATVDNLGSNDELGVELELLINDEIATSVVIPELISGSSYTLSHEWTPTAEGTYNVTAYAPPLPDEEYIGNNVASANVRVRLTIAVAVLDSWDIPDYFYGGWNNNYQTLVDALNANGFYAQAVTNEEIIGGILSSFDVFVIVDNVPNEAAVPYVVAFWSSGGGVVAFDSSICFLTYAGILPPEAAGGIGYAYWDYETRYDARISSAHPITAGYEIGQILYGTPGDAEYRVDALAGTSAYPYYTMLVEDVTRPNRAYVSAYEPPSSGNVVHIWDQSHWRNANLQLMILNVMEWAKAPRYEHDLAASLAVPVSLRLDYPTMINATVLNRGLNNETNVELHILINGVVVDAARIPELLTASSYKLSYLWTPTIEGNYNITAYVVPVPDEANTANNQMSSFATVVRPLIQPVEGQWANYTISSQYGQIQLNATYSYYLSPTQMHVDLWLKNQYGDTQTAWLTLNIINRQVEAGIWQGYWYPLWIENDVTIGSTVRILSTSGTVTTSRFIEFGDFLVDCWGAQIQDYSSSYTFWFDKVNGLVVAVDLIYSYYYNYTELWRLTATNVPLNYLPRLRIQTDPQSGPVGTEVTVTGTKATPNGSVEIYWDNTLIGTRTTDENGNVAFTFVAPSSTMGSHSITVLDLTTNVTDTSVFTIMPSITIAPLTGPIGTRVEITGSGFGANETLILSFDDMQIGTVFTDSVGSFTATFNVPLSRSGLHLVKAWYGKNHAYTTFTVTDVSPLDVNMEVGAVYFKGETVEFYVQTAFKGRPVDVTSMTNTLYMADGTTQTLTYQRIATGLYKIKYTISGKGSMLGTYTLIVEASLVDSTVNAYGTSITTFIVKPTWERETTRMAALSAASIGLVSAMVILWRKEKKQPL